MTFFLSKKNIFIFALISAILIAMGQFLKGQYQSSPIDSYNNYLIFKQSFFDLISNIDLYSKKEFLRDIFKYSPSFAILFAPYAVLPDWLGLILWTCTNMLIFTFALYQLQFLNDNNKAKVFWFCFPELLGSAQNLQSNPLLAALLVLAYHYSIEKSSPIRGALSNALNFIVKIYGVAGLSFAWMKGPKRFRHQLYFLFFILIFALTPFLISQNVSAQYLSWFNTLSSDHSQSYGMSLLGLIRHVVGRDYPKQWIQIIGVILLLYAFIKCTIFENYQRYLIFLLLWLIVFNHRTESPTMIVSTLAAAFWIQISQYHWTRYFGVFFFVFTSVGTSDLTPAWLQKNIFHAYDIKALPSSLLLFIVLFEIYNNQRKNHGRV